MSAASYWIYRRHKYLCPYLLLRCPPTLTVGNVVLLNYSVASPCLGLSDNVSRQTTVR